MFLAAVLAAAAALTPARPQAFEIQVYPSETVAPGRTFAEIHSNTATKGTYNETLEVTRGFTDWFETGFYLFSGSVPGEGWDYSGNHVRPRVRAPKSWGWPVGASLSAEVGWLKRRFSETRWDAEIRPIVDWENGDWYVSVNPALERGLVFYGEGSRSFSFAPAAKLQWCGVKRLPFGVEYYGDVGPVENPLPASQAQHQLGPAFDPDFGPDWEVNFAPLFGLTRATDAVVLKLIVGRRF